MNSRTDPFYIIVDKDLDAMVLDFFDNMTKSTYRHPCSGVELEGKIKAQPTHAENHQLGWDIEKGLCRATSLVVGVATWATRRGFGTIPTGLPRASPYGLQTIFYMEILLVLVQIPIFSASLMSSSRKSG